MLTDLICVKTVSLKYWVDKMCNGVCNRFEKKIGGDNHYCQGCAKFINKKYLVREVKSYGRLRCSCCNGLVRNKPRLYRASSAQAIKNIIFSS